MEFRPVSRRTQLQACQIARAPAQPLCDLKGIRSTIYREVAHIRYAVSEKTAVLYAQIVGKSILIYFENKNVLYTWAMGLFRRDPF